MLGYCRESIWFWFTLVQGSVWFGVTFTPWFCLYLSSGFDSVLGSFRDYSRFLFCCMFDLFRFEIPSGEFDLVRVVE